MTRLLTWLAALIAILAVIVLGSWFVSKPDSRMVGLWKTEGYGMYLDVSPTFIDIYQTTSVSCMRTDRLPAHQWLIGALEEVSFTVQDDQMQVDVGGVINPVYATRTPTLPDHCATPPQSPGTAQENFDVFWHAMNEHYAFFDLHGVDWDERRATFRPEANTVLDEAALFDLLKQTLDGLDDGHLYIAKSEEEVHSPAIPPAWYADRHMVRDTTLAQFDELTAIEGSGLSYGWATPQIGYVHLTNMRADGGWASGTAEAANAAFAQVATLFADAEGIIVDVRYNPGGSDNVALAYASYFTAETRPAFSKTIRTAAGYTDPLRVTVEPVSANHLAQPTVVLTSGFTGSAAEILILAMRELPQVTTMGTPTSGGLSDVLDFKLPNGWELGLSHQKYFSPDGTLYEGIGITPDMTVEVDVDAAKAGNDLILDAAIRHLETKGG